MRHSLKCSWSYEMMLNLSCNGAPDWNWSITLVQNPLNWMRFINTVLKSLYRLLFFFFFFTFKQHAPQLWSKPKCEADGALWSEWSLIIIWLFNHFVGSVRISVITAGSVCSFLSLWRPFVHAVNVLHWWIITGLEQLFHDMTDIVSKIIFTLHELMEH